MIDKEWQRTTNSYQQKQRTRSEESSLKSRSPANNSTTAMVSAEEVNLTRSTTAAIKSLLGTRSTVTTGKSWVCKRK